MDNPYELDINIKSVQEHYSKIPRIHSAIASSSNDSSSNDSKNSIKCYNPIKKQRLHKKNYLIHKNNNKRIKIN